MSKGADILGHSLAQIFRNQYIQSEYPIKVGRSTLYLDYYVPKLRIAFEMDGRQHKEYVPYFHKTRQAFEDSKVRDTRKEQWCADNYVALIRINHDEIPTVPFLRKRIHEICSLPSL